MRVGGYQPRNSWLHRQLDRRWRRWLIGSVAGAALVSAVMAGFVAPRQATLRMRYEIARLSADVRRLEDAHRRLLLEREALTSPTALAGELDSLGLATVPRERVLYLGPSGQLASFGAKPAAATRPARPARNPR